MFKKIQISRFAMANIIILALLFGAFLSPVVYQGFVDFSGHTSGSADPLSESDQKVAIALQQSYMNVFKKAAPSVVYIKTNVVVKPRYWFEFYQQVEGAGSGFIIDKDGYIVTNSHVVAGAQKIEVIFHDDTRLKATLIGRDESSDVALIKVAAGDSLVPSVLGDSDKVEPGQLAFALGAPFGLDSTFTVGIISAKHRQVDDSKYSRIQTDASINPGNSGGPLLNVLGEVVGINQSIISPNGQGGGSVGIGFAIPINEVKSIIQQLRREKRVIGKPALGVSVGVPSQSYRQYLGVGDKPGLVVRFVAPGSSAEDAGLLENDFIASANGKILKTPEELSELVQREGIGAKLDLVVIREGKELKISAKIGEDASEP